MLSNKLQLTLRDRKVLAALCALILVTALFSVFIGYQLGANAQSSTLTMQTHSGGPNSGAPTYTIFKENSVCYAKDAYGAIAFSSTNAEVVLQNTIGSNRKVMVQPGDYLIDDKLLIDQVVNFELFGTVGSSRIYTTQDEEIFVIARSSSIHIHDLKLEGDSNAAKTQQTGISIYDTVYNTVIENCIISGLGYDGINILFGANGTRIINNYVLNCGDDGINPGGGGATPTLNTIVANNYVSGSGGDGIHVSEDSLFTTVIGNHVDNVGEDGIGIYNSTSNIIDGNIINSPGKRGIVAKYNAGPYQTIVNNQIYDSGEQGIFLAYDSHHSIISGNTIKNPTGYAINLEGNALTDITVTNNIVSVASRGIYGNVNNSRIEGNSFAGITQYGIALVGGATYGNNSIIGNSFSGTFSADVIYLTETHCIISNNKCNVVGSSYSVNEDTGGNFNFITNNDMAKGSLGGYRRTGANSIVSMNFGYFVRGTAAISSGNVVAVSFSLAAAPNIVTLGANGNVTAWFSDLTANGMNLHAPDGYSVSYFAEYSP